MSRANIDGKEIGPRESDGDLKLILYFLQYIYIEDFELKILLKTYLILNVLQLTILKIGNFLS